MDEDYYSDSNGPTSSLLTQLLTPQKAKQSSKISRDCLLYNGRCTLRFEEQRGDSEDR
jgi:hypothetical protein